MNVPAGRPSDLQLAPIPTPHVNLYTPKEPFESRVLAKHRITEAASPNHIWHLVLSLAGSRMAGKYRSGQSIGAIPEGRFSVMPSSIMKAPVESVSAENRTLLSMW